MLVLGPGSCNGQQWPYQCILTQLLSLEHCCKVQSIRVGAHERRDRNINSVLFFAYPSHTMSTWLHMIISVWQI